MTDGATQRPWRFEPHNGFGSDDPDGEPWPFGYISEDRPGSPIFELSPVLGHSAEQLYANVALIVRAVNERDELIGALQKSIDILERNLGHQTEKCYDAVAIIRTTLAKVKQ